MDDFSMMPDAVWSLNVRGRLFSFDRPIVMAIINVTPDSFFDGGKYVEPRDIERRVDASIESGSEILDVGGYSSRPGASHLSEEEEWRRLEPAIDAVMARKPPETLVSVDTFRSGVARKVLDKGVDIINDISAGSIDPDLLDVVAAHKVPYILMHMKFFSEGNVLHYNSDYGDMFAEMARFFSEKLALLESKGIRDVVIDPGFGFGKDLDQNYELVRNLTLFHSMGCPILCGVSRKSMIQKLLGLSPDLCLNATTALHTMLLTKGAKVLRVHDVEEAKQAIEIFKKSF